MSSPKRVLIADDHVLFAEALEAILGGDGRLDVIGRAKNGEEAVTLTRSLRPDVVLMDISMPVMDGIEATRQILDDEPGACVLVLTGSDAAADVDAARRAGAVGYVTKDRIAAELVEAILEASGC
jgi:two-component system, NarL family, nitrate/nitrite response regulator NarL